MVDLTTEQRMRFAEDGFLVIEKLISLEAARRAAERFEPLFGGNFPTGVQPDEWNWRAGRDAPDLTRQICNGWKSDPVIADIVLRESFGALCAQLMGWPGARLCQDNVIWKPPGARPLGFHQDDSYQDWITPPAMATCWLALDDTTVQGGTVEYVRGSHRWQLSPMIAQFHAPEDPLLEMRQAAAREGVAPDVIAIEVAAGGGVIHHGRTWHGSGANRSGAPRRALVSHCISSEARFHPTNRSPIYSRYKRVGDEHMDESFFPILWTAEGRRSSFLDR